MIALNHMSVQANREKYGNTDYFKMIGSLGGTASRGSKKPRGVAAARKAARRKVEEVKESALRHATMEQVLAELNA